LKYQNTKNIISISIISIIIIITPTITYRLGVRIVDAVYNYIIGSYRSSKSLLV